MIILGVSRGLHDASATLLIDNEVIFHLEAERLSNVRHDRYAFQVVDKIKKYVDHIDYLVLTSTHSSPKYTFGELKGDLDPYSAQVLGFGKSFIKHGFQELDLSEIHHDIHASTAFYNSGFDRALCIVKDALGSKYALTQKIFSEGSFGFESGSVFIKEYPNETRLIEKNIGVNFEIPERKFWIEDNVYLTNSLTEATVFEEVSKLLGFTHWDAGKTMGLSSYGKENSFNLNIYKENLINEQIFGNIDRDSKIKLNIPNFKNFEEKANFAYKIQKEIQDNVANDIIKHIEKTKEKNICLSGGFFLNCVSNYNLLKRLPKDINIYIEPMATDAGNSLGAAKYIYYHLTKSKKINKQINLYYGPKYNYTIDDLKNEKIIKNVDKKYVANLISNKNIVAIFQGKSEAGHRALGNRSILYDPRDVKGKDHVNTVKNREFFRPFAGTVLEEEATKWFDMKQLKNSKFMMYAVDVLKNKQKLIPAITHVDGTCRIQTVSKEDNQNFYELINEFYKITNIPILLNTSFNLAGNAIVETLEDALKTMHNSAINFLYLPELEVLVTK